MTQSNPKIIAETINKLLHKLYQTKVDPTPKITIVVFYDQERACTFPNSTGAEQENLCMQILLKMTPHKGETTMLTSKSIEKKGCKVSAIHGENMIVGIAGLKAQEGREIILATLKKLKLISSDDAQKAEDEFE